MHYQKAGQPTCSNLLMKTPNRQTSTLLQAVQVKLVVCDSPTLLLVQETVVMAVTSRGLTRHQAAPEIRQAFPSTRHLFLYIVSIRLSPTIRTSIATMGAKLYKYSYSTRTAQNGNKLPGAKLSFSHIHYNYYTVCRPNQYSAMFGNSVSTPQERTLDVQCTYTRAATGLLCTTTTHQIC